MKKILFGFTILRAVLMAGPANPPTPSTGAPAAMAAAATPSDAIFKKEYIILPGDQMDVFVRRVPEASRTVIVRADGNITLPLVHDVPVAGLTTREINAKLTELFAKRLVNPEVTVMAGQIHQPAVYVAGEVGTPGAVPLRSAATAMQALSLVGGARRTAAMRNIVIIRLGEDGKLDIIPLDINSRNQRAPYEALARLRVYADDVIFVPESGRSSVNRFIDDFVNRPLQGVNSVLGTYVNFRLVQIIRDSQ